MTKQGWKEGQSLGNRSSAHVGVNDVDRLAAARVGVLFKDDNLGLGAKRKSKDIEGQRTGLDAFQGLLGRLNGKSDQELEKEEKKVEDRKLEMYVKGRWGGMVFVKGGTLVGDRDFGTGEEKAETTTSQEIGSTPEELTSDRENQGTAAGTEAEKMQRKEEKRQRKEARKLRREESALRKAARKAKQQGKASQSDSGDEDDAKDDSESIPFQTHKAPPAQAPDEPVSSSSSGNEDSKSSELKRKRSSSKSVVPEPSKQKPAAATPLRNGRHLLRGRNIQAKKMAFADMKGLEEIFMKTG
jgi:Pin2-interacting protein X1